MRLATERFEIRLVPQDRQALDALAAMRGRTRSELVRDLLRNAQRKAPPTIFGNITHARDEARSAELAESAR